MSPTRRPRVKVCCIRDPDEAALAVRCGASAVGLVSAMPSGPGVIDDRTIAEIARVVPPGVASFLLTSRQDVGGIVEQQRRLRPTTLQICDRLTEGRYDELREALPGVGIVQVVHVTGPESVEEALGLGDAVDAVLLDSGNQALAVKQLGGTGRCHDWALSRRIREESRVPVFLAGGLQAGNVADAIAQVAPFALDVCSGVRTAGRLDEDKLRAFFEALAA
jgi:phosphoribosylanthranilate isomerase